LIGEIIYDIGERNISMGENKIFLNNLKLENGVFFLLISSPKQIRSIPIIIDK
jgi:hypothetical protein